MDVPICIYYNTCFQGRCATDIFENSGYIDESFLESPAIGLWTV